MQRQSVTYLQEEAAAVAWNLPWQLLGQLDHDELDQVSSAPLGDCVHGLAPGGCSCMIACKHIEKQLKKVLKAFDYEQSREQEMQ